MAGISSVIPTETGGSDLVYAHDKVYGQSPPQLRRMKFVSPGLFTAMGNRLIAGREFTWTDTFERRPVVRSRRAGSQSLLAEVQQAVWSINPNLPLARVRTLQEILDKSLARTSFTLVMLEIAGAMALLIGVIGIYGVISNTVSQRTREIGIRMALGARRRELTRMLMANGLALAAIGEAFGLAGAAAMTRALRSLVFEVNPLDPFTYAAVSIGLLAAALAASYLPALRATAVDPCEALRAE